MNALFWLVLTLAAQPTAGASPATDPALAARIDGWFQAVWISSEDGGAQLAEAQKLYAERGLATVSEVGDQAAYEFVALLVGGVPLEERVKIASQVKQLAARHELPVDAATFYAACLRLERIRAQADRQPPSNPDLRDRIERMLVADQAVRQEQGFHPTRQTETDRQHAAELQAILDRYRVPTFALVGTHAASDFVILIQHQPARFRERVLPKLKANVAAGQADPNSYVLVYDRSRRDLGKKQRYGEQWECAAGGVLHAAPIEDEAHVNERRAELGLLRLELHARRLEAMSWMCSVAATKP